jgi:hypothetical protein
MQNVYLNGVSLHDPANGYFVGVPIEGLESSAISTSTYNRAGVDGTRTVTAYQRERRIGLRGLLRAFCDVDHLAMRKAISALVPPTRDANSLLQPVPLRFVDDDGGDYTIQVVINGLVMPRSRTNSSEYQFDLIAADYAISGTTEHLETISVETVGGFSIPFSIPFSFTGGTGGAKTIVNAGDATAYPIITLAGPLTNPRITNSTVGRFLQLNLTINTGSSVVIDMRNKTIVQGGTTNRINAMTSTSKWWWIDPGANTIALSSSIASEAGTATVTWHDAYSGL